MSAFPARHPGPRHALRVLPSYPYGGGRYTGDVIPLGNSTREQVEDIRDAMATGRHHEIVELAQVDGVWEVVEP